MKRELEALLFATDSPLTASRLKKLFPEASTADLKAAVKELEEEYAGAGHAFTIVTPDNACGRRSVADHIGIIIVGQAVKTVLSGEIIAAGNIYLQYARINAGIQQGDRNTLSRRTLS